MGTNYYAIKNKISLRPSSVHIGKSSLGHKFLFRGYSGEELGIDYEQLNISSVGDWKKYLYDNELVILDEYDEIISHKDFFDMVERMQLNENEDDFKYNGNVNGYRFDFREFS